MEENLVGYWLNALEPDEQDQAGQRLQASAEDRQRLEALKQAFAPLEADKDSIDPPPHLAFRSLARVAEYRCRPLPQAPEPASLAEAPAGPPPWWRRADVLIAASLFIAILGVGIPGIQVAQAYKQRVACADNLHQFHTALTSYADHHGGDYPGFDQPPPYDVAGMFVPILHDAGFDLSQASTRCPAVGDRQMTHLSTDGLKLLSLEDFENQAAKLSGCYAYSLGHLDPASGQRVGIRRSVAGDLVNDEIPVLADRPAVLDGQRGNSPNHNGGQNVLHVGGHVRFLTAPTTADGDDIYRNKHGKVAAGLDRFDAVLGSSGDRP